MNVSHVSHVSYVISKTPGALPSVIGHLPIDNFFFNIPHTSLKVSAEKPHVWPDQYLPASLARNILENLKPIMPKKKPIIQYR